MRCCWMIFTLSVFCVASLVPADEIPEPDPSFSPTPAPHVASPMPPASACPCQANAMHGPFPAAGHVLPMDRPGFGYTGGAHTAGMHLRFPYYSYRHPWFYDGPASLNVTIVW